MGISAGRDAVVAKNGTALTAVRTKSISHSAGGIDTTSDDSAGYAQVLDAKFADRQLTITVDGLESDQVLRDAALTVAANLLLTDITFTFANGDAISGDFFFGQYDEGSPYKEASTFSGTFTSSGAWTYTPAV